MSTPATAPPTDSAAQQRLAQSRTDIEHWLARNAAPPPALSLAGFAARAALPLLEGLRPVPTATLLLGTLAKAWLRSGRPSPVPDQGLHPVAAGLTLVRRHPVIVLGVVVSGGLLLWAARRKTDRAPSA